MDAVESTAGISFQAKCLRRLLAVGPHLIMDCSRIPSAKFWDRAPASAVREYRRHARHCLACRGRVLVEAPEQLLGELDGDPMPEEFWLGFWDSLEKKLPQALDAPAAAPRWTRMIRRAAAVAAVAWLAIVHQNLPESPSYEINPGVLTVRPVDSLPAADAYPLIEEVADPSAHYYIFQSADDEKIVMIINPDMDL